MYIKIFMRYRVHLYPSQISLNLQDYECTRTLRWKLLISLVSGCATGITYIRSPLLGDIYGYFAISIFYLSKLLRTLYRAASSRMRRM